METGIYQIDKTPEPEICDICGAELSSGHYFICTESEI